MESWKVPDVFGVQLLTRGHRAPGLGDAWRVETLEGGARLVSHRDPAAWFSAPLPPPELVAAARADFDSLLFTQSELEAVQQAVFRMPQA